MGIAVDFVWHLLFGTLQIGDIGDATRASHVIFTGQVTSQCNLRLICTAAQGLRARAVDDLLDQWFDRPGVLGIDLPNGFAIWFQFCQLEGARRDIRFGLQRPFFAMRIKCMFGVRHSNRQPARHIGRRVLGYHFQCVVIHGATTQLIDW